MGERWSLARMTTALVTCGSKGMMVIFKPAAKYTADYSRI
jgi:hypothetical protein